MSHDESQPCACGGSCSCQSSQEKENVYLTRDEYIAQLERYLVDLKAEIVLVEKELVQVKGTVELAKA